MIIEHHVLKAKLFIKEFETRGSYPSLFLCSDNEKYVVKHSQVGRNYIHLINEFIAAQLAQIAQIPIPDFSLITVDTDILPSDFIFNHGKPQGLCFGSKYLHDYVENVNSIDYIIDIIIDRKDNFKVIEDIINICVFDVWLRNNDRSPNNPNLLIQEIGREIGLIAIDHSSIFTGLRYSLIKNEIEEIPPIGDILVDKELFSLLNDYLGIFIRSQIEKECDLIANISDNVVTNIVNNIPAAWPVSIYEKRQIINFINYRKGKVKEHFNILLEQIGL
jgi:hypothetical protein